MPSLYGYSGNANVAVGNTIGLYQQNTGAVTQVLTNAQTLLSLLSNASTVGFSLTSANTQVQGTVLPSGVTSGTYGSTTLIPVVTVGTDGRVSNISTVTVPTQSGTYSNTNVAAYLTGTVTVGNLITTAGVYWANGQPYGVGTVYGNANVAAYLPTYTGSLNQSSSIVNINANVSGANAAQIAANTIQSNQINALNLGLTAANVNIQTISANLGAFETYANANFITAASDYGNANVAVYLNSNLVSTINTTGNIKTVANIISPNYLYPNGVSILTGINGTYSNTNVAVYLNSNLVSTINTTGNITTVANIISPNYLYPNGVSILTGIGGTYSNTNVAAYLTTATISTTGNITGGNVIATGYVQGDGSKLANTIANNINIYQTTSTNQYTAVVLVDNQYTGAQKPFIVANTATVGNVWTVTSQTTGNFGSFYNNGSYLIAASTDSGSNPGLYKSTDGGNNWSKYITTGQWAQIFNVSGNILLGSTTAGIYRSTNNGDSWAVVSGIGGTSGQFAGFLNTGSLILAANYNNYGIFKSSDAGVSWTQTSQNTGSFNQIFNTGSQLLASYFGNGFYKSTDGGQTWTLVSSPAVQFNYFLNTGIQLLATANANTPTTGGIYKSTDGGNTWSPTTAPVSVQFISMIQVGSVILATSIGSGIYKSTDNGNTWSQTAQTTGSWQNFLNTGTKLLAGSNNGSTGNGIYTSSIAFTGLLYNATTNTLAANISAAGSVTAGNLITTNGVFWANGTAYSTGGGSSGVTSITAGTGITANASTGAVSITNAGVTAIVAGTGITANAATGVVSISSTGGSGSFSGNLAGNILFDSVNERILMQANNLSAVSFPTGTFIAANFFAPNALSFFGNGVVNPATGSGAATYLASANLTVGTRNGTTWSPQGQYNLTQMYPDPNVTSMQSTDRARGITNLLELYPSGKNWGSVFTVASAFNAATAANSTTVVAQNGVLSVVGTGYVSHMIGVTGASQINPVNGSANVFMQTGVYGTIGFNSATAVAAGRLASNIAYARLFGGVIGGGTQQANLTMTNAVGLHITNGWAPGGVGGVDTITNRYAVLNEDAGTLIQTNGNIAFTSGSGKSIVFSDGTSISTAPVTQIVAGTNITVSPVGGTGVVTVNAVTQAGTYTNSNVTNLLSGGTYTGDVIATTGVVNAAAINSSGALTAGSYVQANNGLYSINTFSGTYSDGIVVDYVTGNGRISVGTADKLTFYTGGVGATPTLQIAANGAAIAGNLITTNGVFWANGTAYSSGGGGTYANVNVSQYLPHATGYTDGWQMPIGGNSARPSFAGNGMIRFNSDTLNPEWYNGTDSSWYKFSQSYTPATNPYTARYLIVAGGGSGGSGGAGGGGAGGLLTGNTTVTPGTTYSFTVGAGGGATSTNYGAAGSDSTGFSLTAIGGGYGGPNSPTAGGNGGSGGGSGEGAAGGSGTSGQGNSGGTGGTTSFPYSGSGGGGAGAAGTGGTGSYGGNGGNGLQSDITGTATYYAGGGGGSAFANASGTGLGGNGGGGNADYFNGGGGGGGGSNGAANSGGGGGASCSSVNSPTQVNGYLGGSGVVIISVPTASYTGTTTGSPTVTTSGSNTIMTFTASGSYTA